MRGLCSTKRPNWRPPCEVAQGVRLVDEMHMSLSQTPVRLMICRMYMTREKMCVCVTLCAYDDVFSLPHGSHTIQKGACLRLNRIKPCRSGSSRDWHPSLQPLVRTVQLPILLPFTSAARMCRCLPLRATSNLVSVCGVKSVCTATTPTTKIAPSVLALWLGRRRR